MALQLLVLRACAVRQRQLRALSENFSGPWWHPSSQSSNRTILNPWLCGAAQEITTFTDCVNCLIAFTNNPHSLDVALNAIAFLRFCAMKLADGTIGEASRPDAVLQRDYVGVHGLRVTQALFSLT